MRHRGRDGVGCAVLEIDSRLVATGINARPRNEVKRKPARPIRPQPRTAHRRRHAACRRRWPCPRDGRQRNINGRAGVLRGDAADETGGSGCAIGVDRHVISRDGRTERRTGGSDE